MWEAGYFVGVWRVVSMEGGVKYGGRESVVSVEIGV